MNNAKLFNNFNKMFLDAINDDRVRAIYVGHVHFINYDNNEWVVFMFDGCVAYIVPRSAFYIDLTRVQKIRNWDKGFEMTIQPFNAEDCGVVAVNGYDPTGKFIVSESPFLIDAKRFKPFGPVTDTTLYYGSPKSGVYFVEHDGLPVGLIMGVRRTESKGEQ